MSVTGPGTSIQDFTPAGNDPAVQPAQVPQLSNDQIRSGVQSSNASERDQAELALAAKYRTDPRGALDILRQLPVERQHQLATTIGDRQGELRGDQVCTTEDAAMTGQVLQALGLPDQLRPAAVPRLTNAQIETGLKSNNAQTREQAELALAAKYRDTPQEAIDIIKRLPTQRALECANGIADQQGNLRGDLTCRPEDSAVRDAVLNRLADDPDFGGKWAGEAAKGLPTGSRSGVSILPPGTTSPRDAVQNLMNRQLGTDGAPRTQSSMTDFVKGMYASGGDAALTNTLAFVSNEGPTPRSLNFLRSLSGPGCNNFLARAVQQRPGEVQTALENMFHGIGNTPFGEWNDRSNEILSAFETGIGSNQSARRKFGEFVQTAFDNWSEPGKKREINGNRVTERQETTAQTQRLETARGQVQTMSQEYERAMAITDRNSRIAALRELQASTNRIQATVGGEYKASAGIDIEIFSAGVEATLRAELQAEHSSTNERETTTTTEVSREVENTRRQLQSMSNQVERRITETQERSRTQQATIDADGDAEGHISAVRSALRMHGARDHR